MAENGLISLLRGIMSDARTRGYLHAALMRYDQRLDYECSSCGFRGNFMPLPLLIDHEQCPQCGALERQRLFALALRDGFVKFGGRDVLEFAPDQCISRLVSAQSPKSYKSADLKPGRADMVLNIESLDLPDGSVDRIICSHVLEHVNDAKALSELYRVLRDDGEAVLMIPIVEGWNQSYEDPSVTTGEGRERHFNQQDHVRFYGSDFRDRVARAGFLLDEYTALGPTSAAHKLFRGEKVFLAKKQAATARHGYTV